MNETENAEVIMPSVKIPANYDLFRDDGMNYVTSAIVKFSAVNSAQGWRLQRMETKTRYSYSVSTQIKNQEVLI